MLKNDSFVTMQADMVWKLQLYSRSGICSPYDSLIDSCEYARDHHRELNVLPCILQASILCLSACGVA